VSSVVEGVPSNVTPLRAQPGRAIRIKAAPQPVVRHPHGRPEATQARRRRIEEFADRVFNATKPDKFETLVVEVA
jgi:hypothetical protein